MKSLADKTDQLLFSRRLPWLSQGLWCILLLVALAIHQQQSNKEILALARQSAELSLAYTDSLRRWNLHSGGIYLPTAGPGLHQVETSNGLRLQHMVPAQMLSHIQSNFPVSSVYSHITSLNPINPENAPDHWEQTQLQQQGDDRQTITELTEINNQPYYRMLHPLTADQQCLNCHDDNRLENETSWGALSINVPIRPLEMMLRTKNIATTASLLSLWLLGSIGIATTTRSLRKRVRSRDKARLRLQRSNNLYSALSATNQAIAQQLPQTELFQHVCDIAVRYGGFKLASVGIVNKESLVIEPVARSGSMCDYIDEIHITMDPDSAEGNGPTSIAIRENRPIIVDNFLQQLAGTPWYEAALRNGIRASAAYPIHANNEVIGALKVYTDETDFFSAELSLLVQQMANDLSFAVDHLQQQQQLETSQALNQTLIDALPYPAMLARYSTQRVVAANRKAQEMGIVVGEISNCCQPPAENGNGDLHVKERQRDDGRWDMVCWCPVDDGQDDDIYLNFAVDITERKKQESQINDMAHRDALTDLANRRYFNNQLEQALQPDQPQPFTLIMLDLNRFKQINDTHGHLIGDQLLIQVARRLRGAVRECDTLCRWGGDEFIIMLPDSTLTQANALSGRIHDILCQPFKLDQITVTTSCSIGLASYPENGTSAETLVAAVDLAMYKHKDDLADSQ
ncbi:MAG: diguanylate cyclase [Desulfuromonas sp.]|nr:diguanylate cyclase [Desulfuromonas sp.]